MKDTPRTSIAYRTTTHDGDDCQGWIPRPGWGDLAAWIDDPEDTSDYPALIDFEDGVAIFSERQTIGDEVGVAVEGIGYSPEQLIDAVGEEYDVLAAQEFIAWTFVPCFE
jgi:hypothetical protein